MSKKWCADSWCMWAEKRAPREVLKLKKLDLVVVVSVILVMVVGGCMYTKLGPSVDSEGELEAGRTQICEGMTLAQVWDMWGVPDQVEFDAELHRADYKWFNPFRHVLFATDPDVWVVISHWGYTGLLAP